MSQISIEIVGYGEGDGLIASIKGTAKLEYGTRGRSAKAQVHDRTSHTSEKVPYLEIRPSEQVTSVARNSRTFSEKVEERLRDRAIAQTLRKAI
jgi:hypothetical protein